MENWKDIEGYNGDYQVSDLGNVRSIRRGAWKLMCPNNTGDGYTQVFFNWGGKRKNKQVSRLVGAAFIENPKKLPQINHKDGNKLNNRADNLEWCTQSHNIRHADKNGLRRTSYGESHWGSKLKEKQVRVIKHAINYGAQLTELARVFGVSQVAISDIKSGRRWKHVII